MAHHGSRYSTTPPWVRAVKPRIAVISCGAGNEFGHPNRSTVDRLEEAGAAVYRTDLDGEYPGHHRRATHRGADGVGGPPGSRTATRG